MAGGDGHRMWPLSRQSRPKQLLTLGTDQTLVEQALERALLLAPKSNIWVGTTAQHAQALKSNIGNRVGRFIIEPGLRNTAPAILLNCLELQDHDPEAMAIFFPADAFIPQRDSKKFAAFIEFAVDYAFEHDEIVLLGVEPTYPATGYGYIEYDKQTARRATAPYPVTRFREKPSYEVAQQFLEDGNKLWNVSIFCAKVSTFIREFAAAAPAIYNAVCAYRRGEIPYDAIPADSIDYAVIERSEHIAVLPVDFSWCDVGNLEVYLSLKQNYNTLDANYIAIASQNNLIDVPGKLVALVGVDNLCVVEVDDALLIVNRSATEDVRGIVKLLKQRKNTHYL
jgi:mannose-1-phosphate guanylyltransferase